jgi:restriction system protein
MANAEVPPYNDMLLPTLKVVTELGGSASIGEIVEMVVKRESFSEAQQAVLHNDGPTTEINYRLAWARSYLKAMGLLTNSARGIWTLTDDGTALVTDPSTGDDQRRDHVRKLWMAYVSELRAKRRTKVEGGGSPQSDEPKPDNLDQEQSWKEQLLGYLIDMLPDAFERLASRLLREADFDSVNVTGKSSDGGIDGLGVYRLGLVSFPVFFQCKRYQGSVGASAVRDFRGAMTGRGDKGLLITTGTFTAEAKKEATRDGAPPIDLIDGDRLCDLLKKYELGVQTVTRTVEDITVDRSFFSDV